MSLPTITAWVHLGDAPECTRSSAGGQWRATFTAAANDTYQKNGQEIKRTTWLRCVAFGSVAAQIAMAELKKGAYVWIKGELTQESYEDDNGAKRTSYEVNVSWPVGEVCLPLPKLPKGG